LSNIQTTFQPEIMIAGNPFPRTHAPTQSEKHNHTEIISFMSLIPMASTNFHNIHQPEIIEVWNFEDT